MKNSVFVAFFLFMLSLLLGAHVVFRDQLRTPNRFETYLNRLSEERKQAEFRSELAHAQLREFQEQVATIVPEALKDKAMINHFPLRELASAVVSSEQLQVERASSLFERAKSEFREKNYETANNLFVELIENYPDSIHLVTAHFLLAEGKYQLKEFDATVNTIEKMIALFPESELTGFALLRLGHIYEKQERIEDASDIYRAIIVNFEQPELRRQAEVSLKGVRL